MHMHAYVYNTNFILYRKPKDGQGDFFSPLSAPEDKTGCNTQQCPATSPVLPLLYTSFINCHAVHEVGPG